jgi:hypothetical protein
MTDTFMLLDSANGVVSTATIDYVSLGPLIDDDPMTRPNDVIQMLKVGTPVNPAAVFGGLLALGDPRVCELLQPHRSYLTADDITTVSKCYSGLTAKCVVEFYLDWLDEYVESRDYNGESIFGNLVAGLYRLASDRAMPFVVDGHRPFPVPTDDSGWPDITEIDPDEFASSIEQRLLDIERREGIPKIMPHAIRAFDLHPKSNPEDIAVMH